MQVPDDLAQKVHQQQPGLDLVLVTLSVDRDRDGAYGCVAIVIREGVGERVGPVEVGGGHEVQRQHLAAGGVVGVGDGRGGGAAALW